ncbi:flagellar export chaperone FliS [Thiobacter aerophilum]|uniref:Flagellar secretion chaperone FliS n=1 Tax=Thiobacter aerophilum TaxID=3121275 RepID=A0ABV0ED07_9BURK
MNTMNRALTAYTDVDLQTAVATASPVQLIVLLYDGALAALASAKGRMQEMKLAEKGALISKAIGIVEGLRSVLDHEKGGEIARNLEALYDYMKRRLASANLRNDPAGLDEVMGLLGNLREAWVALAARERQQLPVAQMAEAPAGLSLRA